MCFSAEASFISGAVLATAGAVTVKTAETGPQKVFASIPLVFSIQQFGEGLLWVALHRDNAQLTLISTRFFLFIAQAVWPLLVPLAIMLLEKNERRKRILKLFVVLGSITSAYLAFCIFFYGAVAQVQEHHIRYIPNYPHLDFPFNTIFYLVVTVFSPIVSTVPRMKILGIQIMASVILAQVFYTDYFISVWCFFAALLSAEIYFIIRQLKRRQPAVGYSS